MKLIIAGSRDINVHFNVVWEFLKMGITTKKFTTITEIVSGGALGVDSCGEVMAQEYNLPVRQFLPEWTEHGRKAGPMRNKQMADYADALLLIWDGKSRGSANMKENMQKLNKPIFEVVLNYE